MPARQLLYSTAGCKCARTTTSPGRWSMPRLPIPEAHPLGPLPLFPLQDILAVPHDPLVRETRTARRMSAQRRRRRRALVLLLTLALVAGLAAWALSGLGQWL